MARYFFDVVGEQRSELDYRGRFLPAPEDAFRIAELIALDLGMKSDDEWNGWSVTVRDALGSQFFSVPVAANCLSA
jgi:hypothetical protein